MRFAGACLLLLTALTGLRANEEKAKEWPACDSAAADKTSSSPICDPCSPKVYTEYNNEINTQIYEKPTSRLNNYNVKGWTRFMMGTGRMLTHCPLMHSCGGIYPIWLNAEHPEADAGIVDGEVCAHFSNGNCCTYKRAIKMKNCGNYMVYLMTYNSPVTSSYHGAYCVEPKEQPDVCNNDRFTLKEDTWARGELQTTTSNSHDPIQTDNTNNWFSFAAGKGTMKKTCPGLHHCGWRYPMWLEGDYPTEEGQVVMRMAHLATSASNICSITNSQPVYIVKCGGKYYHKYTRVVSYSGACVNEDYGDLCKNAVDLSEEWRGTTYDKARDHCDTNGLNDFESWYRIAVHEKKMPDHCVAPNKCGGDTGYYVGGELGHPAQGEGIVGRTFYYSSSTNCKASGLNGHILNCGSKEKGDDYIYKWTKPSGCDRVFCAEQNPCSSTVYKRLDQDGRQARTASSDRINDYSLQHGWYRFPRGEGIMAKSPVLPGHSGVTYPGWYDGEYPLEDGDEKNGKACFSYNGNHCYRERPVTVRNCKNFYVYHLQATDGNYGYTFEQDVCKLETMKLDQEWRLQYNLDAIALSDSTLKAGWYEVTIGEKQLASDKTLHKHGGSSKYPGWIEGEHPTAEEGIVERTVFFTTSDSQNKGSSTKVYIRNCGTKYIYYLRPYSNNYFYAIAEDLCQEGSYEELDQDHRLYSNPSDQNNNWNNDNKFFKTYTQWYRFMNGNGRAAEYPRIRSNWRGGFQYPYQFEDGAHASVPNAGDISEEFLLEHYRSGEDENRGSSARYTGWTWRATIKNCGGYFLYRIPPLSTSYNRAGLVVDDDDESVCEDDRYVETDDKMRLVSSVSTGTGTSDYYLNEGWYRLTAGLGYMPTSIFVGTQCSSTYHGHLQFSHPKREDGIVENAVQFRSTSASVQSTKKAWVKACDGFYVYRLTRSPGTNYRYCEATPGCKHARELEDQWRVNSRKLESSRYESSVFGNDGWVYFSQGLKRLPESPPPKSVGGCTYNGYIESHPKQGEGAVPRVMKFPGVDKEQMIEVENCGDKYVYFLTKSIQNDYCYVADTDVCSEDVYKEVNDVRRLHYSHKYGTGFTRFDLDNKFNGWIRYTIGEGRMMEKPPALTNMCTTEYQGWIDGTHPKENEGVVSRKVCWKYNGNDCYSSNEISVKNCGGYYVYGIAKPPPNNQWGHCVEQDKTEVCEAATKLNNPRRGMLTPTTEYIHDQQKIVQDGYYRFMSGLGRLTAFQVKDENCGGKYRVLINAVLEKDEESGDALFALRMHTTGWTGSVYRNVGLKCDGYWVYRLFNINTNQLAYCVEEDVCESSEIKWIYSTKYLQWLGERTTADNEWHVLSQGWYEVKVGNRRLAYSPSDVYDCSATYPGYINSPPPKIEDGIVPGQICYRTSASADTSSCTAISMKMCADKELYYLTKSPNANYAICVETDVCSMVEGTPLDDTWRLSGTPKAAGGRDVFSVGWYRVTIGNERLAHTREEAKCGATYQGWMTLGRHPAASEGTVNTKVCYDTGNGQESNCRKAQVVNCGGHYLYHLEPASTHYGVCIESSEDSMCKNYGELGEDWRSTEYAATVDKSDHATLVPGWYRFTTGLGRMATHCPDYQHGGGYYPSYAYDLPELPSQEEGVKQFTIYWRHSSSCTWTSLKGYVRNCGDYPVYWLPKQGNGHTTYNVEADSCDAAQYEVIDDERRLAWKPATDKQSDHTMKTGWYRFNNGLKKINEECTPQAYGGAEYPGWMEGGHPDVGQTVTRTVFFRYSTNCKQTSKSIKVKNCGSFYIYRLVPTAGSRGYTVASEPCDSDARQFDQEDRSIYERSTSMTNDNGIAEGWYQFTTGSGVMPKAPPMPKSCRTQYPTWLNDPDPSPGEGVVTRTLCSVNGNNDCQWQKEIKVRNCGNNKMLYYLTASPPYSASRYCVEDSMDNICKTAKALNDDWRGSNKPGTGKDDKSLPEGWYKFSSHGKRMANYPVRKNFCGADYPIYMNGQHAEKGTCVNQQIFQVYTDTNWAWRSGSIYECHCMNGDYIYYHVPSVVPLTSYKGTYCVEQDPCKNHERMIGETRSPWYNQNIGNNDHASGPKWVKIDVGLGVMPRFVPEEVSCGNRYAGWYDGEMPTEVGKMQRGRYCFVTSSSAKCSNPRDARVLKCPGGFFVYHLLPTANQHYGYCADSDVCDVASEEWGREENKRLQYTSTRGFYSSTRHSDNSLGNKWIRVTTGLQRIPTTCPGYMSCGTLYPGWMEGELPTPAERVVDRQICFRTGVGADTCCNGKKDIKVVSCVRDNKQFYLYKLYSTSSNYGYCIDENPDEVCKLPSSSINYITDERHGTGHYYDSNFLPDYKMYSIPKWMEVTIHGKRLLHQPPTQYFCGGIYAGWVEDPEPGPNEGVVDTRACYRDSMSNEYCYQPMPLKMKNCDGKMRYLYAPPSADRRNMCVEEDICEASSHTVYDGETWRLAFTKTDGAYKRDYLKMSTSPYRGWFRFSGVGHNRITEVQQEYLSCGTQYPGWMMEEHPGVEDGVVKRTIAFTTAASTYSSTKSEIFVKNCGNYMLYNMNFNWWNTNWALCVDTDVCKADVQELDQDHRLQNFWGKISQTDDRSLARGWYRFTNGFEKMPETCPAADSCGSLKPGYLSQPHPEIGEGIVERKVCFGDADQCCVTSRDVLVKNCGTHFVYRLYPTTTYEKYCVEESSTTMCAADAYTELDDDWRGETNVYDSTNKHDDTQLTPGNWYRFTNYLGRMPEYSMSIYSCGHYYPGYLKGAHPSRADGVKNYHICWSTSMTNEGQACRDARVRNCGSFYVYQWTKPASWYYGFCVAQDQCQDARDMSDRWRLVVNPYVSGQSKAADQNVKKGWYRLSAGHGTMPLYEPDTNYGGAAYPSWMLGDLPDVKDGEVERTAKFAGTSHQIPIRVKNCGEHYTYWLQPTPNANYVWSIDTDVCLHANPLAEEWRNMFYVSETQDDLHTDYKKGKDWYRFTTGFQMMSESPPGPQYSCGTKHPAYLNQAHPAVEDGVVPREVCIKEDEEEDIYQACFEVENIRVKNCGDYYAYQLNPSVTDMAYCVYNRKTSCEPKVVHAKYGELAVVNCTLNSEKDFDSSEVEWTKLNSQKLPDDSLSNIEISDDSLLLNIKNIADQNAGVYALYIPSTATSELVEVILYSAVEASQKYYTVKEGGEVTIETEINVVPAPAPDKITWVKVPNKKLSGDKYVVSDDKKSLTIKGVTAKEAGTYRVSVEFEVDGKKFNKHTDVIVQLEEDEEAALLM